MRLAAVVFAAVTLLAATFSPVSANPAGQAGCGFVLGFATLHDLIPQIVGECVTNEAHNPANGDTLQQTTNGLMVWRKSDNWTAFTNGFQTWVNGPLGLQQRLNGQRFSWEQNPEMLPIVPALVAGDRCHTAQLSLSLAGTDAGAGSVVGTFVLTNNATVPCTFYGYPGARLLDDEQFPLPTDVVRGGGFLSNMPGPGDIPVPAGGTASFKIHWGQVPVGSETVCPASTYLAVTPPDEYSYLVLPIEIRACGGGRLNISAVQPPV